MALAISYLVVGSEANEMSTSLKKTLKRSDVIVSLYTQLRQAYYERCISDVELIRRKFKKRLGREVELENPIGFNDKLQWLKLNWYDPNAARCADKYRVREFVAEKIGKEYLNELYGVYESVSEIDLDKLPNSFALKATHGSGFNIICKNKRKINWSAAFAEMKKWLKTNYYWENREWVYRNIKPRILCERYLMDRSEEELKDYRFFCFDGVPRFIAIDFSITDKSRTRRNLYDLNWSLMEEEISYPKELNKVAQKPEKLEEMIALSRELSRDFPHVRVDLYYVNGNIYFGEMTFFHQSGMGLFRLKEFEYEVGNWLELPNPHIG